MKNVYSTSYAVKAFIVSKQADKLSNNTILSYESKLKAFVDYCGEDFYKIDSGIIRNFFDHFGHTHSQATTRAVFTAVKVFYNHFENEVADFVNPKKPYKNPMSRLKAPKADEIIHDPIDLEDFKKMITYCTTCKNGVLYSLCLYFLLDTGTRASEFLSLNIDDINFLTNEVVIRVGKGHKRRSVFFGRETKKLLRAYLKTRTDNDPALWYSSYKKRLTYSGLNRILKTVADGAGIAPPTAHMFRRAFCKNLILDNTNPYIVQVLMGWSNYAVLQKYAKLYSDDIRIAHGQSGVDKWL